MDDQTFPDVPTKRMKKLYRFYLDCGRMGSLDGLFIAEDTVVAEAMGKDIYYGECLGKHSEITCELDAAHLTVKSEDQEFISKLEELLGTTLSGFNPINIYLDDKEDGCYDEEDEE